MGYFQVNVACAHYDAEWNGVVKQINQWPKNYKSSRDFEQRLDGYQLFQNPPTQGIEAKALYIFTVVRRLIRSAGKLVNASQDSWNLVFIETSYLLFPMIELIGEARKADNNHQALDAGIQWLRDHTFLPPSQSQNQLRTNSDRLDSLKQYMFHHSQGPQVSDLFFLRNYYFHGMTKHKDPNVTIANIINAELPFAITHQAETAMHGYWHQLRQDDGTKEWINRLANADIQPFVIQGSGLFEAGLVDPDIVDYLEDLGATVL